MADSPDQCAFAHKFIFNLVEDFSEGKVREVVGPDSNEIPVLSLIVALEMLREKDGNGEYVIRELDRRYARDVTMVVRKLLSCARWTPAI